MADTLKPFIEAAQPFVLRMFACDCAERHFWRSRMTAHEPAEHCWAALKLMRNGLLNAPDDEKIAASHEQAMLKYSAFSDIREATAHLRSQRRALHRSAWAITSPDPKHAALTAAQALATMGKDSELTWALARLSWLTATHQWAGDRMAFLIPEGEIDTPEPLKIR